MPPYDFSDVLGPASRDNAAGLAAEVLYAPISQFDSIEVPVVPYAAVGDEMKIETDHTFLATFGFVKLRFVPDSNGLVGGVPEERDSSGYRARMEGDVVCSTEEEAAEVLRNLCTEDVMVLLKTANGKYIQLGTEDFPAQVRQTEDTTGTSAEGQKKQHVAIIPNQQKKFFYSGTVTLKP